MGIPCSPLVVDAVGEHGPGHLADEPAADEPPRIIPLAVEGPVDQVAVADAEADHARAGRTRDAPVAAVGMIAGNQGLAGGLEDLVLDGVLVGFGQHAGVIDQIVGGAGVGRPLHLLQRVAGGLAFVITDLVARNDSDEALEDRPCRPGQLSVTGQRVGQGKLVGLTSEAFVTIPVGVRQLGVGCGPAHFGHEGANVLSEARVAADPGFELLDFLLIEKQSRVRGKLCGRLDAGEVLCAGLLGTVKDDQQPNEQDDE